MYVCGCTFFHSFFVQAIYRLCRILYPTRITFQSFHLYVILSVGIWMLVFVDFLPSLLIGDIEYLPYDYHCQFAFTNIRASLTVCSVGFIIPFSLTVFLYAWTLYHVRKQSATLTTINRQANIRRDVTVLKRLVILLTFLTITAAPHILLPIIYAITAQLPVWVVPLEWLLTFVGSISVSIILVFVSPHLKKLLFGLHQIQPIFT